MEKMINEIEIHEIEEEETPHVYANNEELYQPDGTHENFEVYAGPLEEKEKHSYKYVNNRNDMVGQYYARLPERASKKILRQIFLRTGIHNPVYHIYNDDTRILYKYAGLVEKLTKKKGKSENEFLKINKIPVNFKYTVRQIEYKKF